MSHFDGCGHTAEQCKVLKSQADKMKASHNSQSPSRKKAWKKKEETNAIVQAVINQMQANEKHKTVSESDDSGNELQVNELSEQFCSQDLSDSDESC